MKAVFAAALALVLTAAAPSASAQSDELRIAADYDGRLLVKVFEMHVEQKATASSHSSTARFTSYGVLAAFKKLDQRVSSSGRIARGNPQPGHFWFQNFAGQKKRRVETTWAGGDVSTKVNPPYINMGEPPATKAQKLAAADPLTQLMRMTLNGSRGQVCSRTVRFFDGKQLYDLVFSNPRASKVSARQAQMKLTNLVRCDVRFIEVAGFKAKPPSQRDQGLKHGIVIEFGQVGQGGPWVVSGMKARTPLGAARLDLTALAVAGKDPTG